MFLHGCNYPWSTDGTTIFYGLDFGANVWGSHLGVSTRRDAVARDFARMAALGFTVVRWFCSATAAPASSTTSAGLPAGADAHLFADLDAALEIARDAGIRLDLVLLDHRWMFDGVRETIADPVTGALLEGTSARRAGRTCCSRRAGTTRCSSACWCRSLRRYGPFGCARRSRGASVLAWEFMNEPDFLVEEWERDLSRHVARPLPFQTLARLIGRFSDAVHDAHAGAGHARRRAARSNLWAWDDDGARRSTCCRCTSIRTRAIRSGTTTLRHAVAALGVNASRDHRRVSRGPFATPSGPRACRLSSSTNTSSSRSRGGYCGRLALELQRHRRLRPSSPEPLHRFAARYPALVNPRHLR